jgi:predicted transposase YbfD/YdcC
MEKLSTTKMSYEEFDKLVRETWPDSERARKFECVAEFEWSNDEDHSLEDVSVKDHTMIGEYQIMGALIHAGKLEAGNYLIQVWW